MTTITTPNGVTHTTTGEEDFVEFLIEPEFVEDYKDYNLEPYMEEWEIDAHDGIEDKDYTLGLRVFDVPNLQSIVNPEESMDLYEISKCFKISLHGVKAITRFIDATEEESEFID